jgi:hypothetical protein
VLAAVPAVASTACRTVSPSSSSNNNREGSAPSAPPRSPCATPLPLTSVPCKASAWKTKGVRVVPAGRGKLAVELLLPSRLDEAAAEVEGMRGDAVLAELYARLPRAMCEVLEVEEEEVAESRTR